MAENERSTGEVLNAINDLCGYRCSEQGPFLAHVEVVYRDAVEREAEVERLREQSSRRAELLEAAHNEAIEKGREVERLRRLVLRDHAQGHKAHADCPACQKYSERGGEGFLTHAAEARLRSRLAEVEQEKRDAEDVLSAFADDLRLVAECERERAEWAEARLRSRLAEVEQEREEAIRDLKAAQDEASRLSVAKGIEPKIWLGWDHIQTVYDEVRVFKARAEQAEAALRELAGEYGCTVREPCDPSEPPRNEACRDARPDEPETWCYACFASAALASVPSSLDAPKGDEVLSDPPMGQRPTRGNPARLPVDAPKEQSDG